MEKKYNRDDFCVQKHNMKILILTQYFPPEVGAPQNRLYELAVRLQKKGADISVLTAMSNYPQMEVHEKYKGLNYFYEEINYLGKFQLSDDESSFKSISPGGYFKFRLNDIKVKAQSDMRGEIEYKIFDGKNDLTLNDEGKILATKAIKEMIYWGYDAEGRMERVYQKGGSQA